MPPSIIPRGWCAMLRGLTNRHHNHHHRHNHRHRRRRLVVRLDPTLDLNGAMTVAELARCETRLMARGIDRAAADRIMDEVRAVCREMHAVAQVVVGSNCSMHFRRELTLDGITIEVRAARTQAFARA